MGGAMKGSHGHGHNMMHAAYYGGGGGGGGGAGRRRWNLYMVTVIMLLVFGGGVLGVMGLHRIRDRRIYALLIKEKDHQILNLQFLLQKEREQAREIKSKAEELTLKIHDLRAQKVELNGRILEMESTISSLKDEQKTIELSLQEKENEAKSLRERYADAKDQNPEVHALTEALKQKEAEIEDLKHQLQFPTKVWSVSSDDPSVQTATVNANVSDIVTATNQDRDRSRDVQEFHSQEQQKTTDDVESKRRDGLRYKEAESSGQKEEQRENGRLLEQRREMIGKQQYNLRDSQEKDAENGNTGLGVNGQVEKKVNYDLEKGEGFQTRKYESKSETTESVGRVVQNQGEEAGETHFTNGKDLSTEGDSQSERVLNSNGNYYQGLGLWRGGVKMEMQDKPNSLSFRSRWKHNNVKRTKGKRWMATAKNLEGKINFRGNGAAIMRNHQLVKGIWETTNRIGGKPINQLKIQGSTTDGDMQQEAPLKNVLKVHDKLPDGAQGEVKSNRNAHTRKNSGENTEDSPPRMKSWSHLNYTETEDMNQNVEEVEHVKASQQVNKRWAGILTNSSTAESHTSYDGQPRYTRVESYASESSNEDKVQYQEDESQPKSHNFNIREHTENKNDAKPDDGPRQTVAEKNGMMEDFDKPESSSSVSTDIKSGEEKQGGDEDKAETDKPGF